MQATSRQAQTTSPDLLDVLRQRREQAAAMRRAYCPEPMARDTMLYWLARAAREAREAAGRKQVHIGAAISRDQSAIYRFEQGVGWPRDPELFIAGYAEDLDISPFDLWQRALSMWQEEGQTASVKDLNARRHPTREVGEAHDEALAATRSRTSRTARTRSAKANQPADR